MFTKKHFEEIAKVLCETHTLSPQCDDAIFYITANLGNMFKKDNPRFDIDRFERAARCVRTPKMHRRKSKSGLRLFGADEAYRPPSGATIITEKGVYRSR